MANNPKLEFPTNIPIKFLFLKMFKQGESQQKNGSMSKWFGVSCKHDEIEKVFFANEYLWAKLQQVKEGDTVQVTHAEIKGEKGTYKEWQVTINGVVQGVSKTKDIADSEETKEKYQADKQVADQNRENNIRWCNALNNATAIVVAGIKVGKDFDIKTAVQNYAEWLYTLPVPVSFTFDEGGDPK